MSTYSSLYYHLVWSTKNREPLILEIIEPKLYSYIVGVLRNHQVDLVQIGGMPDHLHLLIESKPDVHIPSLVKDIKISSTKMLRSQMPSLQSFAWQSGYGIFTVSKSMVSATQDYIQKQKEHHRTRSFNEEWLLLLTRHHIHFDEKYVFG